MLSIDIYHVSTQGIYDLWQLIFVRDRFLGGAFLVFLVAIKNRQFHMQGLLQPMLYHQVGRTDNSPENILSGVCFLTFVFEHDLELKLR